MITVYAIPNCDKVKKAKTWLAAHNIDYQFHNYKKEGIEAEILHQWIAELGWEQVINRKGMTWRKLDESVRSSMNDDSAINIMLENQSIIKRPLIDKEGEKLLGFNEAEYEVFFK